MPRVYPELIDPNIPHSDRRAERRENAAEPFIQHDEVKRSAQELGDQEKKDHPQDGLHNAEEDVEKAKGGNKKNRPQDAPQDLAQAEGPVPAPLFQVCPEMGNTPANGGHGFLLQP